MTGLLGTDSWHGCVFTGQWTPSHGGTGHDTEPATGHALAEVGMADAEDIREACARAGQAQPSWAERPQEERGQILLDAVTVLREHHEELAGWIMRECGGNRMKAEIELHDAEQRLLGGVAITREPYGQMIPSNLPRWSFARRVPHGVVGVISPFNFPLILSIRSVAPALAAGNAVVLKPDLRTPVTGGVMIARALEEAGLPEGVLQVMAGSGEAGSALVEDPDVGMVSFTGSTAVGRKVGEAAGRDFKHVALELGGNNPLLVLDDADVEAAAAAASFGTFFHQGQICMATGRHLVHESLAEQYAEALVRRAKGLRLGDPFREDAELGPLIDEGQRSHVDDIVQRTLQAGAHALVGAKYEGLFYEPTVLTGVSPGMPAYDEEIFGPVGVIATFRDDEEAVALANDTEYGLKAAVHSGSFQRALNVGGRLDAGAVHINEPTVSDESVAPFPASKASGVGSFGGPSDLEEFTRWRWVTASEFQFSIPFGAA